MTVIQIGNAFARASAVSVLQTVKIVNSKNIFGCTVCVNNRLILILLVSLFVKGAIPIYLILSSPGPNLSYLCHFFALLCHLFALLCHFFAFVCTFVSLFCTLLHFGVTVYLICVNLYCQDLSYLCHFFALLCHFVALFCTFVSLVCTLVHFCVNLYCQDLSYLCHCFALLCHVFALLCHFFALLILFVMKSDETSAFCIFYLICVKKVQK